MNTYKAQMRELTSVFLRLDLILICSIFLLTFNTNANAKFHPTKIECIFSIGDTVQSIFLHSHELKYVRGYWAKPIDIVSNKENIIDLKSGKDSFILKKSPNSLYKICLSKFHGISTNDSLYFTELVQTKAYKEDDPRCNGHQIAYKEDGSGQLIPAFNHRNEAAKKKLKDLNFAVVINNAIYRSKRLGDKGIRFVLGTLKDLQLPVPKTIASIHVMGFGGRFGDYNLKEISESKKQNITFLHSYAYDPKLTVYMDGTDPSSVFADDPHHGNIYDPRTLDKFIPDPKVRAMLRINESVAEGRYLTGDTKDFLLSLINIIDAPWPVLIHCKGGKHKTGMFSIIFEYMAFSAASDKNYATEVRIPSYKNRIAKWFQNDISFSNIFLGGPMHVTYKLSPAEGHYAEHNMDVFRFQNIEFTRGIISGETLDTQELKDLWQLANEKFKVKLKEFKG